MTRQLPNALTVLRILLTPGILLLLVGQAYRWALLLALLAALSDLLDGWLARRYGWQSRLGGLLDPIADKLLLNACFLGLWWAAPVPGWLVGLVLGRDLVIVAGALAYHWLIRPVQAEPSLLSKLNTVVQLIFVLGCLVALASTGLPSRLLQGAVWVVAAVTLVSGLDYVLRYARRAWREASLRENGG